jgi:hypothetical protein
VLAVLGLCTGGATAYVTGTLLGPQSEKSEKTAFVPTGPVLAPLVLDDGRLAGYTTFEVQLEVPAGKSDFVAARMPLLLHAINLRTFRSPLASGPDGMLPDVEQFRAIIMTAAPEAFGEGMVRHAAITHATPS